MRVALMPVAAFALCALAGCSSPQQQARSDAQCDAFARSGGYPTLTGGPTYGNNSDIEKLPGQKPLIFGAFDDDIVRHLDEEDYLRNYCEQQQR